MKIFTMHFYIAVSIDFMEKEIEAIYENGLLRIVKPAKIESDKIVVKIINRDEILTDEDIKDILKAINERNKGKAHSFDDVFG